MLNKLTFAPLLLVSAALATTAFANNSDRFSNRSNDFNQTRPYYTAASNSGAEYWSWTSDNYQDEVNYVREQMRNSGSSIDRETSGYYQLNGYNSGIMVCREVRTEVSGYGAQVFENAVNLVVSRHYNSCTFEVY